MPPCIFASSFFIIRVRHLGVAHPAYADLGLGGGGDAVEQEAIRAAIAEALETTPRYAHITGEETQQELFQRKGEKHSVKHAYHGGVESNTDMTVFVRRSCSHALFEEAVMHARSLMD